MKREINTDMARSRPAELATVIAIISAVVLMLLIFVGSRGMRDFDSALIGYAVATLFAVVALTYRYALWISRPPTWRYFRAGWANFFSWRNFRNYTLLIPKAWWTDIFGQTFILKRGLRRWITHMCIFWGVLLSLAITLPLTFGWLHFTLLPNSQYQLWFFGIPLLIFPISSVIGFAIFHGLDFTALLLMVGLLLALWRRITDAGQLAIQRFGFDLLPLVMLVAISVTGLALTASSSWWGGRFYWFLSLTHQAVVVVWLLSLPFGKFFHIIERPASIGVSLYQTVNQDMEHYDIRPQTGRCRRCGQELPSEQFVQDLQAVLGDLGQHYDLGGDRGALQEYCPTCKRVLRGEAYYQLMGKRFL
ncbi:hypothetical protein KSF_091830 [Reticulibacter mediterranei]|uniref:Uncharacterized protein n=1 Tax=Reticulibacter mediterranei TaxID=2778369 RepID=A0A8J3IYK0_9CHLR|nr:hypothetical protein [Reticulibacter mediterranei]GHO99135.1 hypothetical protein KSF_091830 [Reticulibacter mediterranei]